MSSNDMEFDMIGIDASVANAFRRILLAEVNLCILYFLDESNPHLENIVSLGNILSVLDDKGALLN